MSINHKEAESASPSSSARRSPDQARAPAAGAAAGAVVVIAPKKVCFICGSYTSQTINIFEPRNGPNIIELINEKFKVPVSVPCWTIH